MNRDETVAALDRVQHLITCDCGECYASNVMLGRSCANLAILTTDPDSQELPDSLGTDEQAYDAGVAILRVIRTVLQRRLYPPMTVVK